MSTVTWTPIEQVRQGDLVQWAGRDLHVRGRAPITGHEVRALTRVGLKSDDAVSVVLHGAIRVTARRGTILPVVGRLLPRHLRGGAT